MSLCAHCAEKVDAWIDAFQGFGPIRGWRQFQSSGLARQQRSAEIFTIRVNDRARLIRQQVALIKAACDHNEVAS